MPPVEKWRAKAERLNMAITPEEAFACEVLEQEGLTFGVDFGLYSADVKAMDRWFARLEREFMGDKV